MDKKEPRRKKKPNKAARDKIKTEKADLYNQAFNHGYRIGYEQGRRDHHA